jgi:hypothetical protein
MKPCKLLNNSTFYHLKSLIALPIQMIRTGGGGVTHPIPTSSFTPVWARKGWWIIAYLDS